MVLAKGNAANVSRLRVGTHTGTRVDAPAHFLPEARRVLDLPLDALIGDARIVDALQWATATRGMTPRHYCRSR